MFGGADRNILWEYLDNYVIKGPSVRLLYRTTSEVLQCSKKKTFETDAYQSYMITPYLFNIYLDRLIKATQYTWNILLSNRELHQPEV